MNIKTTFLDKINNEDISLEDIISLFSNLENADFEHSNTGYFEHTISKDRNVILHFTIINSQTISFRYDDNKNQIRNGIAWYSRCAGESKEIIDAGDENYIPSNSLVNNKTAIKIVKLFFINPLNKPAIIEWSNAESFEWPN